MVGVVDYRVEIQKKNKVCLETNTRKDWMRKGCICNGLKLKMYYTNKTKMH